MHHEIILLTGIKDKLLAEQGIPFPEAYRKFIDWCGAPVKPEPWLALSGGAPIAYGICPDGDEFLLQLSISFHQRGEYSVKRMIFEMSDDLWDIYMDKKDAVLGVNI